MTMQRLCQRPSCRFAAVIPLLFLNAAQADAPPANDFPTAARVEYVNECIARHDDSLANVYQCSCVIDRIASQLSYDKFVSAITFARYSGLPGEGGGLFRDSEEAKTLARMYRSLESEAQQACGLKKS